MGRWPSPRFARWKPRRMAARRRTSRTEERAATPPLAVREAAMRRREPLGTVALAVAGARRLRAALRCWRSCRSPRCLLRRSCSGSALSGAIEDVGKSRLGEDAARLGPPIEVPDSGISLGPDWPWASPEGLGPGDVPAASSPAAPEVVAWTPPGQPPAPPPPPWRFPPAPSYGLQAPRRAGGVPCGPPPPWPPPSAAPPRHAPMRRRAPPALLAGPPPGHLTRPTPRCLRRPRPAEGALRSAGRQKAWGKAALERMPRGSSEK